MGVKQYNSARKRFDLWKDVFPNIAYMTYVRELRSVLHGCSTVLDVGCGGSSPLRFVDALSLVGVEGWRPNVLKAVEDGTHDTVFEGRAEEIGGLFADNQFEAVVALDVVEHLVKDKGAQFLKELERVASKLVVVLTPNGFLPQHSADGDLEEHLSGWTVTEMTELGYEVTGMYGYKNLRGECQNLKGRPKFVWGVISEFTHYLYTRKHPQSAAALFCVKRISG